MSEPEKPDDWSLEQRQYIRFLAAGKTDTTGKKWTKEEFARQVLKCSPDRLYDWQRKPGFKSAVFEETMGRMAEFLPDMVRAQVHKSIKRQDTPAFLALMRQTELLKSDKVDQNTNLSGEVGVTVQTVDFKNANDPSTV